MKVAAFLKYDARAASTRQRLLQYAPLLEAAGVHIRYKCLLSDNYVQNLSSGKSPSKSEILRSYLARIGQLLAKPDFDLIWVYAELFPYLPAAFERLALRSRKPIIYDFDDAFFHQYDRHPNALIRSL